MRTNVGRRLQIVLAVLEHEAETGRGLGVVGVSKSTGREKSQISRGLQLLRDGGLVDRDDGSGEFVTGRRLLDLAARAGHPLLLRRARPICQRLVAKLGERAHIAVPAREGVLTVETFASTAPVQAVGWVGQVVPFEGSAAGQALSFDAEPPDLPEPVAQARAAGFAWSSGEGDEVIAAAAPIRDADGSITAALVVSGPSGRMERALPGLGREVAAAAATISAALAEA